MKSRGYRVKGDVCQQREHPKQKHGPPILNWHDWRQVNALVGRRYWVSSRCCLVSSITMKGSPRQRGMDLQSWHQDCSEWSKICLRFVRSSSLPISYSDTYSPFLLSWDTFSQISRTFPHWG